MYVTKLLNSWVRRCLLEAGDMAVARPALALASAVAAGVLVYTTGGSRSDYGSVFLLPIALALLLGGPELVLGVGLLVTAISVGVMYPHGVPFAMARIAAIQVGSISAVALAGALLVSRGNRQLREARRSADEKEVLLNASQAVSAADNLEHAVDAALLLISGFVPRFRSAAIFLADPSYGHLELRDVIGIDRSELRFERMAMNALWHGWHPGDAYPLYLPNAGQQSDGAAAGLDPGARSCVCAGLRSPMAEQPASGMLYVGSATPDGFTTSQIDLLQAFADRICFPLQKARMQEGLAGMAFTDALTGLHNYRYLQDHLAAEITRSARYGGPLSLILLDIDDFKQVNDRFGHPAGDKVLTRLSDILRATVRETDVPARYGGEEFAIISPQTGASGAAAMAERLRAAVESARVALDAQGNVKATVSIGVATYPEDALDQASLIRAADLALYEAKRAGKNCVVEARTAVAEPELAAPSNPT